MPFSGSGAVRAMKLGDYQATIFPGTAAGVQAAITFLGSTGGEIRVGAGTYAFGTSQLSVQQAGITIRGASQRGTKFTYSGTGDFISVGFDDGLHSGSGNAYTGIAAFLLLEDIWFVGPGKATAARCIVDWENGSQIYNRITIDSFGTGFFGIGADVCEWNDCYILKNTTGVFIASRCDQTTFSRTYFALNGVGCNVESATSSRFLACQFVFSDTADVRYDCPAAGTSGGDIRDVASSVHVGCWYESPTGANIAQHIKFGSSGISSRRTEGLSIQGGYLLSNSSHTANFIDVEAGTNVEVHDIYQAGTITGNLVNITSVASLSPEVVIYDCRTNPAAAYLGGSLGATQTVLKRVRHTNSTAFVASFTPNADSGEIIELGNLSSNLTVNAPTNPLRGRYLLFRLSQDGTGGWTVTWNAAFNQKWSDAGNTASKRSTILFYYDGSVWQQIGAQTPWTTGTYGPLTIGTGGAAITKVLSNTAALDFDLTAVLIQDKTITVTGAVSGDVVLVGVPNGSVTASVQFTGWVSAADTVTIRATATAVGENPASGTFRATVIKF